METFEQKDVTVHERVIETNLLRRGRGEPGDPIRVITQFWTQCGRLLAERDPWDGEKFKEKS